MQALEQINGLPELVHQVLTLDCVHAWLNFIFIIVDQVGNEVQGQMSSAHLVDVYWSFEGRKVERTDFGLLLKRGKELNGLSYAVT